MSVSFPTKCFCFTNLSHLVLEIFRFFKKQVQNLNTLQNNSVSKDLQMGFNSRMKGLIMLRIFSQTGKQHNMEYPYFSSCIDIIFPHEYIPYQNQ